MKEVTYHLFDSYSDPDVDLMPGDELKHRNCFKWRTVGSSALGKKAKSWSGEYRRIISIKEVS